MKKMMIALVAMFVMTMSANAQSENNSQVTIGQIATYLDIRVNQQDAFKTAMAQFSSSMESLYQLKDPTKGVEAWQKIQANHKKAMKKVLDEAQYKKYIAMLELTAKNTAERLAEQQVTANR